MSAPDTPAPSQAPEGWYDDGSGRQRWWDGSQWTHYAPEQKQQAINVTVNAPEPQQVVYGGRTANKMPVSYTRPQTGHSLTKHILLAFVGVGFVTIPYYSLSPNHYWHA